MVISNSGYSIASLKRGANGSIGLWLLIVLLLIATLLVAGYFFLFPPDNKIELEPPLSHTIDPIIRARIEASKQSGEQQSREATVNTEAETPDTASATISNAEPEAIAEPAAPPQVEPVAETPSPLAAVPAPVEIPQWIRDQQSAAQGEIARALIQSIRRGEESLSTEQIHSRATELKAAGRATDAYLLYFYAARQGHGPSALALGSLNDPTYFTTGNELLDSPDPVQAHKWYSVAAATQVEGAQQRLQELRKSTEAAALAGDTSAQRLLLNWK